MPYLPCLNTKAIACIWCVVSSFNSDKNKARSRASSKTLKFCCLWFLIKQALRSWQMWLFLSFLSSVIYNVKNYIHTHTHTHTQVCSAQYMNALLLWKSWQYYFVTKLRYFLCFLFFGRKNKIHKTEMDTNHTISWVCSY